MILRIIINEDQLGLTRRVSVWSAGTLVAELIHGNLQWAD